MNQYHKITCNYQESTHQIAYQEWGDPHNQKVLICVHGLTRNSQDFNNLAQLLKQDYRIICPDIIGRGKSDYLTNPKYYGIPLYVSDMLTLINHLQLTSINWLGTSMGGIIGMNIASLENTPIKRLILNDLGAYIPHQVIENIGKYLCQKPPIFETFDQVKDYVKKIYAGFGDLTENQWTNLAKYSVNLNQNQQYILNYDYNICHSFQGIKVGQFKPIELWEIWDLIKIPVLLLHGEKSDLLLPETIEKMKENHENLDVKTIKNCGHAPALMSYPQINLIKTWLDR